MLTLQEWLNQPEIKQMKEKPISDLLSVDLHRDPMRPLFFNPHVFFSPADGVILYSRVVQPDEDIIGVKGEEYTVNELLREELNKPCLVIGIFMSIYDIHINRIPTNGYITYKKLPSLKVMNLSMREVEREVTKKMGLNYDQLKYALYNERVSNHIFCSRVNQPYFVLQIADFEVDVIAHFDEQQNRYYTQGERFSVVRMGSQVDLIIPFINPKLSFESLVGDPPLLHVEAGRDEIVRINAT